MNLIKIKGIVIKETSYKENDKIITILTDSIGKISCVAKGAKKTNSPFLANAQYLVYSEFVLYKSNNNFYYVNSASVISTFYKLRIDFDKLEYVFEITKLINSVTDENQDTSDVLKLFLNTIYIIEKLEKDKKVVLTTFKIKLFQILGFSPRIDICSMCGQAFLKKRDIADEFFKQSVIYYDYVSNQFICNNCKLGKDMKRYIELSDSTLIAIKYVLGSDIKKIFSFELNKYEEYILFGQVYTDVMTNGV